MEGEPDTAVAIALGVLQGVTEFLPVSSSGHLATFAFLVEVPQMSLALTVLLHAATLLATILVFYPDLLELTRTTLRHGTRPGALLATEEGQLLRDLVVACVPTAVIGLLLESRVEALSGMPLVVGLCFLASAAIVFSTRGRTTGREVLSVGPALLVGIAQGIAVLPGISRSGITIACGLMLGLSAPAAFRFSFLVSMPVIAGATLLELGKPGALAGLDSTAWLAALVTFMSGYLALRWLRGLLTSGHFWLFAWYLVPLGAAVLLGHALGT
ncbi:MAG: undecaprenyl-diphosphate phosphatase [Myxococcales bacterium]|nr:undecaprenyl-diphosphate phosphatase [Myxococcales bacterium]